MFASKVNLELKRKVEAKLIFVVFKPVLGIIPLL